MRLAYLILISVFAMNSFALCLETTERLVVIPAFFSSPDTGFGVGIFGIRDISPSPNLSLLPGEIDSLALLYTERNQTVFSYGKELNLGQNRIKLKTSFLKYPSYFYGIGPSSSLADEESFSPINLYFSGSYTMPWNGLSVGPVYEYTRYVMETVESGGLLDSGTVPGGDGAILSGLGLGIDIDSRNAFYSPSKGINFHFEYLLFRRYFGSSSNFNQFKLDWRSYWGLLNEQVLAVQLMVESSAGDIPFQRMAQLGGDMMLRGVLSGRYIDKSFIATQIEYRLPLGGIFGAVFYAAAGQVASSLDSVDLLNLKVAFGTGLRITLDPMSKLNLRIDIAFSENNRKVYFKAMEAF